MKRMSKKSKFLYDKLQKLISSGKKSDDKELQDQIKKIEDEINQYLNPKKAKFFHNRKLRKYKKKIKFKPGQDPRIIARRQNGQKGGNKTAALYDKETRAKWGSKAGNSTLQKYGRDFFKHIRSKRKSYPKARKAK